MILVPVVIGLLGLVCLLAKKSMLGIVIGINLMIMGATSAFVVAGVISGRATDGQVFAVFVALSGVAQLVVGYSLAVRLFYLRRGTTLKGLRTLKR